MILFTSLSVGDVSSVISDSADRCLPWPLAPLANIHHSVDRSASASHFIHGNLITFSSDGVVPQPIVQFISLVSTVSSRRVVCTVVLINQTKLLEAWQH